jgi:hypothetical protein
MFEAVEDLKLLFEPQLDFRFELFLGESHFLSSDDDEDEEEGLFDPLLVVFFFFFFKGFLLSSPHATKLSKTLTVLSTTAAAACDTLLQAD